jgi:hypothetical protein
MPDTVTAEFFTSRGLDAATAERFAAEHNAGQVAAPTPRVRSEDIAPASSRLAPPVPNPSAIVAPSDVERAQAEIDSIRQRRMNGEISDRDWRKTYEAKVMSLSGIASSEEAYRSASPGEKNALRAQWDADATQSAMEQSIDGDMRPATGPWDYTLPAPDNMTPEQLQMDTDFRQAMHSAGIPREFGNALGQSVNTTAEEFLAAANDPESVQALSDRNTQRLREYWGPRFDANVQAVREYLLDHTKASPKLRELVANHSELFEGLDTMIYLHRLAESSRRRRQ